MDHDHHLRVHKTCEQKVAAAGGDPAKHAAAERHLAERNQKLEVAQQSLRASTVALLYKIEIYGRAHGDLIAHAVETLGLVNTFDAQQALSRVQFTDFDAFDGDSGGSGSNAEQLEVQPAGLSNKAVTNALLDTKLRLSAAGNLPVALPLATSQPEGAATVAATSGGAAAADPGVGVEIASAVANAALCAEVAANVLRGVLENAEASIKNDDAKKQFGKPLSGFDPATAVLTQMIAFLEANGPTGVSRISTAEGIFRISGDSEIVGNLRDQCERGCRLDDACFLLGGSTHEVADLLKLFFRELPTPLLPATFCAVVRSGDATSSQEAFVTNAAAAAAALPDGSQGALRLLMNLLVRVAQHSALNRMTSNNLAVCFAPTICGDEDITIVTKNIKMLTELIDNADRIWADNLAWGYPTDVSEESV